MSSIVRVASLPANSRRATTTSAARTGTSRTNRAVQSMRSMASRGGAEAKRLVLKAVIFKALDYQLKAVKNAKTLAARIDAVTELIDSLTYYLEHDGHIDRNDFTVIKFNNTNSNGTRAFLRQHVEKGKRLKQNIKNALTRYKQNIASPGDMYI